MKFKNPSFLIAIFSAAAVVLVAVVDMRRTSPGELTGVHGREDDLAGSSGCAKCHGGWTESMDEACLDCHEFVAGQIEASSGLHGILAPRRVEQCGLCHSEHHGEGFAIVNPASFVAAGVPDRKEFEHEMIGWQMAGKHLEQECSKCHENADVALLPAGEHRFVGLEQDCSNCHEDAHEGRMSFACARCHGQESFEQLESLGHDEFLPLIGGHGDVSCRECHGEDTPRSLERIGTGPDLVQRSCVDCHDSPHSKSFLGEFSKLVWMGAGASCGVCHQSDHETFHDEGLEGMSPAQHASTGFSLVAPHDEASCADCHEPGEGDFASRYPGREPEACSVCHEDPHEGQFEDGPFGGQECTACHLRTWFEPHDFSVGKHDLTALPLTGTHVTTDCRACHLAEPEDSPREMAGTPTECDACHGDAHLGFFEPFLVDLNRAEKKALEQGQCALCHRTTEFAHLPEDTFDHGRWTGFPVLGAHAEAGCEECHPRSEEPDELSRRFGFVSEHFGDYVGCVTCHQDPHHGEFDAPGRPLEVDGQEGCARCHVQTSFRTFPEGFDHREWTGFPLLGRHREVGCSACHVPLRRPDELGRTWERARGRECAECHTDPHGGQFLVGESIDCQRCHRSASSFVDLYFDHERHSRFPLGEAHQDLDCAACHPPYVEQGVERIRYRPLKRECVDCHGSHENVPLRKRKRG